MGLEWDTMFYWYRRAFEIHYKHEVDERNHESGEIDKESFEVSKNRLLKRLEAEEKAKEGFING